MKMKLKKLISMVTILCLILSLTACGDKVKTKEETDNTTNKVETDKEPESKLESEMDTESITEPGELNTTDKLVIDGSISESISDSPDGDISFDAEESIGSTTDDYVISDSAVDVAPPGVVSPETEIEEPVFPGTEPEEPAIPEIDAVSGTLTAGEWNDNENYAFLLNLISDQGTYSSYVNAWKYSLVRKLDVVVMDNDGPADNVCVTLVDKESNVVATSFTDIKGVAYLYVNPSKGAPAKCSVTLNGETKEIELDATSYTKLNEFKFDSQSKDVVKLDLCFVIDTTGSMSDELLYLQAELEDVIKTVDDYSAVDIRLSVNFYRDKGDEYVTKMYDFSGDISDMIDKLNEQMCNGGGDYEEAVHTVLDEAVNTLSWREDATKLMFLVLDAPAHREDPDVIPSLTASLSAATEKGIRIMPIASSGVDKDTEFMLRGFSAITNGTYIFLTNHSGVGDSHIEPSIGEYDVEKLNKLLVRVISERITLAVS